MRDSQPRTIYLKDYEEPRFLIDKTELSFELGDEETRVKARLQMRRNPVSQYRGEELVLHGEELRLLSLSIDDKFLLQDGSSEAGDTEFSLSDEELRIHSVPDEFVLTSEVAIKPQENTSLEGLYKSRTMFCTQCEAEVFRKITYYLDRPDVMSVFTTRIIADKEKYPVLLSNGNPVESGELEGGRHWFTWEDPFKKPAYLFALVAGSLASVEDSFITQSGRKIALQIFVEEKDLDKCDFAMASLKKAMKWDEEVYGREYDLDIFMIVAVDDFNMGAMENKGLNIFNTSAVLANPAITTDATFQRIEGIVAHEYFHNWSGNRVTCRDWFQLSLKEGFTVFRDAEFSADMGSRTVKRVEDVSFLRTLQFAEDGGPMAHPVQPASYMEISNFYTLTVYEKGAEVVRMMRCLLGPELFRKGSDLYFERHDGQAVTIEDFVQAMADVSGRDFGQFFNWYRQAGTPRVTADGCYDEKAQTFTLQFNQSCPPSPGSTPENENKMPFHIPITMGLVGANGDLPLYTTQRGDGVADGQTEVVLEMTEAEQTFTFERVLEKPLPSLFRSFSAPVKYSYPYTTEELVELASRDSNGFNRWDACNQLALQTLQQRVAGRIEGKDAAKASYLPQAFQNILKDSSVDPALKALMLNLPSEAYLSELSEVIHVEAIHQARQEVRHEVAEALKTEFQAVYENNRTEGAYAPEPGQIALRSLKNLALNYLILTGDSGLQQTAYNQFLDADNMTDRYAALTALVNAPGEEAQKLAGQALDTFYQDWRHEPLVVNLWFQAQATSMLPGGLERVGALMQHEAFDIKNPNKVRALIGAFASANAVNFHRADGEGYRFLADQVLTLDAINPQIAARLLPPLSRWRKYPAEKAELMNDQLKRIMAKPGLSKDVYEVVSKSLH